jgi:hypothetical protein
MEPVDINFYVLTSAALLGILVQGALITGSKNKKKYLQAVLFTIAAYAFSLVFLRGKMQTSEAGSVLVLPLFVFLFFLLAFFLKEIVPAIGTQTVLFYTIIFWFVWYGSYEQIVPSFLGLADLGKWIGGTFEGVFFVLALILLIFVIPAVSSVSLVYMALTKNELTFRLKLISSVWFIFIAISLIATQIPNGLGDPKVNMYDPLAVFIKFMEVMLSWMFILQLAVYVMILAFVWTSTRDNMQLRENLEEMRERAGKLVQRFSNYRLPVKWALALGFAQLATLLLNHYLKIVPDHTMIALLALFSLQPITGKEKDEAVVIENFEDYVPEEVSRTEEPENKELEVEREKLKAAVAEERKRVKGQKTA